jgi:hypothetical protein
MTSPLCLRHRGSPVAAICHICGEGLCDACWTFVGDGKPICVQCVRDREWIAEKKWSRLVVFVLVLSGLSFWLSRHVSTDVAIGVWIAAGMGEIIAERRECNADRASDGRGRRARLFAERLGAAAAFVGRKPARPIPCVASRWLKSLQIRLYAKFRSGLFAKSKSHARLPRGIPFRVSVATG